MKAADQDRLHGLDPAYGRIRDLGHAAYALRMSLRGRDYAHLEDDQLLELSAKAYQHAARLSRAARDPELASEIRTAVTSRRRRGSDARTGDATQRPAADATGPAEERGEHGAIEAVLGAYQHPHAAEALRTDTWRNDHPATADTAGAGELTGSGTPEAMDAAAAVVVHALYLHLDYPGRPDAAPSWVTGLAENLRTQMDQHGYPGPEPEYLRGWQAFRDMDRPFRKRDREKTIASGHAPTWPIPADLPEQLAAMSSPMLRGFTDYATAAQQRRRGWQYTQVLYAAGAERHRRNRALGRPRFTSLDQVRDHLRAGADRLTRGLRDLMTSQQEANQRAAALAKRYDLTLSSTGSFLIGPTEPGEATWRVWHCGSGTSVAGPFPDQDGAAAFADWLSTLTGADGLAFDWDGPDLADRLEQVRHRIRRHGADLDRAYRSEQADLYEYALDTSTESAREACSYIMQHFGDYAAGPALRKVGDAIADLPDADDPDGLLHAVSAVTLSARLDHSTLSALRKETDPAERVALARKVLQAASRTQTYDRKRRAALAPLRETIRHGFDHHGAATTIETLWQKADTALARLEAELGDDRAEERAWVAELRQIYSPHITAVVAHQRSHPAIDRPEQPEPAVPDGYRAGALADLLPGDEVIIETTAPWPFADGHSILAGADRIEHDEAVTVTGRLTEQPDGTQLVLEPLGGTWHTHDGRSGHLAPAIRRDGRVFLQRSDLSTDAPVHYRRPAHLEAAFLSEDHLRAAADAYGIPREVINALQPTIGADANSPAVTMARRLAAHLTGSSEAVLDEIAIAARMRLEARTDPARAGDDLARLSAVHSERTRRGLPAPGPGRPTAHGAAGVPEGAQRPPPWGPSRWPHSPRHAPPLRAHGAPHGVAEQQAAW